MNKDRFIKIHLRRGYEVQDLGKIVILKMDNYKAIWFFNADGTRDENNKPMWSLSRQ